MAFPHIIRLHGPWEYETLAAGATVETRTGRIKLPGNWAGELGEDFRGRVQFRRRFGRPRELGADEQVWLILEGVDPGGRVSLNGTELGQVAHYGEQAAFAITPLLESRNEVAIDLNPAGGKSALRPGRESRPGGLLGSVRLEIRRPVWLEELCITARQQPPDLQHDSPAVLRVSGRVAGDLPSGAASDLALVLQHGERELYYHAVSLGEQVELEVPANLPSWEVLPAGQTNQLAEIEILLVAAGQEYWQATRFTAATPAFGTASDQRRFRIGERELSLPVRQVEFPDEALSPRRLAELVGVPAPPAVASRQVLPAEHYHALDRVGIAVFQWMPVTWKRVCRRLGHHPCLAAWVCRAEDLSQESTAGRVWLPASKVIATGR